MASPGWRRPPDGLVPSVSRYHTRLNSRRWERVRRRVLDAAGWRCQACGGYGNEVDHIVPLERGGAMYDPANLQVLCRGCHIAKTLAEAEAAGRTTPGRAAWRALVEVICK